MFVLLYRQYNKMKVQLHELIEVREEYQQSVVALKKVIAEYQKNSPEENTAEKKKMNDRVENSDFILLKRDGDYLRKSAVSYARQHNLQEAVERLYQIDEKNSTTYASRKNRTAAPIKRKKNKHISSMTHDWWNAVKREKIFSFPIDPSNFWISSRYGPRRKPDGSVGFHHGLDMAAVRGTPVNNLQSRK